MKKNILIIILLLIVLALAGTAGYLIYKYKTPSSQFQAVFLDNGQVYFGHLTDREDDYVKLTQVYYLQVNKSPQGTDSNQSDMTLVKLGNEMHGPEDMMQINSQHVLFIEDLKNDSKVVQAIENSKK